MSEKVAAPKNRISGNGAKEGAITIKAPSILTAAFIVRGTAPFVQHNFGAKAREAMRATQEMGSQQKGKKRVKEPKDFQALYEEAKHIAVEGWCGIPAPAFRNALISACRLVGFAMTRAKLALFVLADGVDRVDGTPLVRISKGEPHYVEHAVRLETGVMDIRPRPMWDIGWEALVRVQYDADQFTAEDVGNLLLRAGIQVGVGEGRPDSKKSGGMGWGTFSLVPPDQM